MAYQIRTLARLADNKISSQYPYQTDHSFLHSHSRVTCLQEKLHTHEHHTQRLTHIYMKNNNSSNSIQGIKWIVKVLYYTLASHKSRAILDILNRV